MNEVSVSVDSTLSASAAVVFLFGEGITGTWNVIPVNPYRVPTVSWLSESVRGFNPQEGGRRHRCALICRGMVPRHPGAASRAAARVLPTLLLSNAAADGEFLAWLQRWICMSAVLNEISNSLGEPALYPFVTSVRFAQKLRLAHHFAMVWRKGSEKIARVNFQTRSRAAAANQRVMNTPDPTFPNSGATPTRVLVAEDNDKTRIALVFLLQRHAYNVTVVNDGQAALDILLGSDPPHIALLDWEMPRLDGLHVAMGVRTMPARSYTYIIMLTAHDRPADVITAFAAGVDDFLSKPVDAAQLLARLHCGERVLALEARGLERIAELEKAMEEVRTLQRLLPICMYCKKVRDDADYWHEIDAYIHEQTGTDFSHGVCPECMETVVRPQYAVTAKPRKSG